MGITFTNKETDRHSLKCHEKFNIKISLGAEPECVCSCSDTVFLIDRSCSMRICAEELIVSAKALTDILLKPSCETIPSCSGAPSRISVVSFSDYASIDMPFTSSAGEIKYALNSLEFAGLTDYCKAFVKADEIFNYSLQTEKRIIIFSDGFTTVDESAALAAETLKSKGVKIFCIGFSSDCGTNSENITSWASVPKESHIILSTEPEILKKVFEKEVSCRLKPGATDIKISEKVSSEFRINSIVSVSCGNAVLSDSNTVLWEIGSLGSAEPESCELILEAEHTGTGKGMLYVNESLLYSDKEQHTVSFPSPKINVDCGCEPCEPVIYPEICPKPIDILVGGCEDSVNIDIGETGLESLGRILQLNITLKNVCPNKRVALAVTVNEVDKCGIEHKRGLKILEIPAHSSCKCADIHVNCIKFILPETLDVSGKKDSICNERKFKARFTAHYIDNGLICCE